MSGLDFQRALAEAGINIPIIFITAHGDVPMSVQAMKSGAVEFLMKPFRPQELLAPFSRPSNAIENCAKNVGTRRRCETATKR
jgi:FixJ family two-component response regulator